MTCVWDADFGCLEDEWATFEADVKERSLMLATSALQGLTLYRVGTCPITIRPCPEKDISCGCGYYPHLGMDGNWYNNCYHRTACRPTSEIDIPGPVGYIESLVIDGETVDLFDGNWRLDEGHILVWQGDEPSPIPVTQNLNKPDSEVGTYSITYSKSYPVLEDGRLAVAYLAIEFAKACTPKKKCALPRGVTNVVRNGVSFTIQAGLFPGGLTDIDVVDQFILKWAPAGAPQRSAQVFDPRRVLGGTRRTNSVPSKYAGGSF